MAGELVPLVLLPRYSSYVGASTFTTIGMEVTDYANAIVNVWRGKLIGTSPTPGRRAPAPARGRTPVRRRRRSTPPS